VFYDNGTRRDEHKKKMREFKDGRDELINSRISWRGHVTDK
jgi:hypothetical protein